MSYGLLYKKSNPINDNITISIPTVGEVIDNEDIYYSCISMIVSTPYDMMVQLDDAGIDFTKISCWDLFCLLFRSLQGMDTHLIFGDLDISKFKTAISNQNGNVILVNEESGVIIDKAVHDQIATFLRGMLHIEKSNKKPGNEEARKYLIERNRKKQKRHKKKEQGSQMENLIVALVNTSEFPYNYDTVRELTIYQFYSSLHQIMHKIKFDNTMIGCYAGTVKASDLDQRDLTWILDK